MQVVVEVRCGQATKLSPWPSQHLFTNPLWTGFHIGEKSKPTYSQQAGCTIALHETPGRRGQGQGLMWPQRAYSGFLHANVCASLVLDLRDVFCRALSLALSLYKQ